MSFSSTTRNCYNNLYLPLGVATGPTAQSLLCTELGEKDRANNNTGRGTDTIWPGTQVRQMEHAFQGKWGRWMKVHFLFYFISFTKLILLP